MPNRVLSSQLILGQSDRPTPRAQAQAARDARARELAGERQPLQPLPGSEPTPPAIPYDSYIRLPR